MGVACSTAQASSPELRHVQVKESAAAAHGAMVKAQMELAMQMAAAAVAPPTEHSHSHTHSHDDRNTYTHHSSFAPQQTAQRNELSKQQPSPTPVLVEKEGVRSPQPPAALHSNHLLAPPVSTQRKRCASETFISACGSSSLMLPPANGALPRSHGQADAKAPSHPSGVASQMSLLSLPHLSSPSTSCTTMAGSARSMIESMASPTSNKIELGGNGMGGGNGNGGSGLSARCTLQDAAAIVNAAQAQVQAQTAMTTLSLMSSPASSAPLSPRSAGAALALAAAADSSSLCMSNLSLAEGGVVPALLLPWAVQQQRARALERGM